jgi:hypothetical protein
MNHPIIQRAVELNDPDLAKEALQEIEALLRASSDPEDRLYLLFSRASCDEILGDFEERECTSLWHCGKGLTRPVKQRLISCKLCFANVRKKTQRR